MGVSTDVVLAFGYDLGGPEEGWKLKNLNASGDPDVPWYIEDNHFDFYEEVDSQLLLAAGLTEDELHDDQYKRRSDLRDQIGVKLVSYCSHEYPKYILTAKEITVWRGHAQVIDFEPLNAERFAGNWDDKLTDALKALGLTPEQEKPAWLLISYWG